MKKIILCCCLALMLNNLTGCTVLGMLADSQLSSNKSQTVVDPQTGQTKVVEPPQLLTELGLATDALVVDNIKKLGSDEKAKEICKHNGHFMECRPAGKQREQLID